MTLDSIRNSCDVFIGVVGVFLAYLVFFGVLLGVFGILSSLKICRFLLINFAESSLFCVLCGKRYICRLGKSTLPPVVAVGTNMRYAFL